MYKMCPGRIVKKKHSQNSQPTKVLRYFMYILPIEQIIKYCIHEFCIQCVALETVNPIFYVQVASKK